LASPGDEIACRLYKARFRLVGESRENLLVLLHDLGKQLGGG
jgi:hypothetical protein